MNVLAVFAHPDDEVLGAGGALAKHAEAGDEVRVVVLCDRGFGKAVGKAGIALGVQGTRTLGYRDQELDGHYIRDLAESVRQYGGDDPDVIYTHHPDDLNRDHSYVSTATLTAYRPKPGEGARTILACEVGSSTEWTFPQQFQPNWFVELSADQLAKKWAAMGCYPSEVQPAPHPRSVDGITTAAAYRGQQCGVRYAEAFELLRHGPV